MKEENTEYRNKQRSSFWWASVLWCLLLILAYYGVDNIIEHGKALNEMTTYPVWGYVLWGIFAVALWILLIGPVIHFCNLRYVGEESLRRQVLRAADAVSDYRNEPEDSELRQLAEEFSAAPRDFNSIEGKNGWQELLARFREAVHGRAHDTIIGYCKAVGVGVVFAFNGLLDGLILFAIQIRLVVVLARVFGYKPGALFNGYFLGWIAVNSLVVALTTGWLNDWSGSLVATMLGTAEGADPGMVGSGIQVVLAVLMQALLAGILTYISGRIFLWRLEYEGREVALKTLLKLRAEGRLKYELAQMIQNAAAPAALTDGAEEKPALPLKDRMLQLFGRSPEAGEKAALPAGKEKAPATELPKPEPKEEKKPLVAEVVAEAAEADEPVVIQAAPKKAEDLAKAAEGGEGGVQG